MIPLNHFSEVLQNYFNLARPGFSSIFFTIDRCITLFTGAGNLFDLPVLITGSAVQISKTR
jgi:hypothetical protein